MSPNHNEDRERELFDDGSWPEYRRYVVNQLRALDTIKEAINEQKLRMASMDARLASIMDGSVERRLQSLEGTRTWAKGIGVVVGVLWSIALVVFARWLRL